MSDDKVTVRRHTRHAAIPNSVIRDETISAEARLLLCYAMSCTETWVFYRAKTLKVLGVGRDKYQRMVRELKDARYLKVHTKQLPDGRFDGNEWEIFDEPYVPEPQDTGEPNQNSPQDVASEPVHRGPENPVPGENKGKTASHRGLKNRRPVKPTAGFSGPIRRPTKKENQNISCADPSTHKDQDDFQDKIEAGPLPKFLRCHPRVTDEKKTRTAFLDAVMGGAAPDDLVNAAKAYARDQEGNKPQYVKMAHYFISEGVWKNWLPSEGGSGGPRAAKGGGDGSEVPIDTYAATAQVTAGRIRRAQKLDYPLSAKLREAIIHFKYFTHEELVQKGYP